ncbi:helix-hairpin-helix domain-containing protein [Gammaproteobacteria bacterium]|nr:helix-hairpin-helix domain-containing protein [Gammaproteobacteria bacterium]
MRIGKTLLLCLALCLGAVSIQAQPININQANVEEIAENLQQVGMVKAQAIVDYRDEHGEYHDIDQLLQVHGIGISTLELNKDLIVVETITE